MNSARSRLRMVFGPHAEPSDLPIWFAGLIFAAAWALPFLWMLSTSVKPPKEILTSDFEWLPRQITFANYVKVFDYPILRWAFNSTLQAVVATAACVLAGAFAGYALACMRFKGRRLIFSFILASLMVPVEVTAVPLLLGFMKLGWANSYQALILPMISNVFSLYIFRQYFLKYPVELIEAATIDGAGPLLTFWHVALPMARAPMIASAVIVFTMNWNNYLWPLLVTFSSEMKTLPLGLATFSSHSGGQTQVENYGVSMAAVTLLALPSIVFFVVLQKYFIAGLAQGSVKS
ncbi:MAG: carbohydrate ABC transporter permease [Alsobacter sp.]